MIDLAVFKAKTNIDKALLELKKLQSNIDIHAVVDNLEAAWNNRQVVSYMYKKFGPYITACTGTNKAIMLMREMPLDKSIFGGFLQSAVSKAAKSFAQLHCPLATVHYSCLHQAPPPMTPGRRR